jgi:hypothetical protein
MMVSYASQSNVPSYNMIPTFKIPDNPRFFIVYVKKDERTKTNSMYPSDLTI